MHERLVLVTVKTDLVEQQMDTWVDTYGAMSTVRAPAARPAPGAAIERKICATAALAAP